MSTEQRLLHFAFVALIGSGLHLAASADETESNRFEGDAPVTNSADDSRPVHMLYIPGQGRPPAFAPSAAGSDDRAARSADFEPEVRVYGDSWIERHRRAAQGTGPHGFASAR